MSSDEFKGMTTDDIAYGLSKLMMQKKRYLFRNLTDKEKAELKRLNREIKSYETHLAARQNRMKGF
jgi:Mg/Co/Ni transporter MgtE